MRTWTITGTVAVALTAAAVANLAPVEAETGPAPSAADTRMPTAGDDTFTLKEVTALDWVTFNVKTGPGVFQTTAGSSATDTWLLGNGAKVDGGGGDDTFSVAADFDLPGDVLLVGGDGDDHIDAGPRTQRTVMEGGPGTNTLLGGAGDDRITSSSATDTIDGRGGYNTVVDTGGPRSGPTTSNATEYRLELDGDVGAVRIRRDDEDLSFTASGNRPGRGVLDDALGTFAIAKTNPDASSDLTLVDAEVVPETWMVAYGSPGTQDLADITVPVGQWIRQDESDGTFVIPGPGSDFYQFVAYDFDEVSVHGPWTDTEAGFVHRSVRDLLYTFIDEPNRTQRAEALRAGTLTPAGLVDQIMDLDAYRGYDVDRVFLKYLRRGVDPSGRTYWINSLANGKALWRFRAQLFGSSEYFAKAGGTNAAYVTKAYTDVLGRAPDPSGQAYWTAKLDNGANRGQVALQFLNAPETRRRLVDDQFLRFLDRLPTPAEQSHWVAELPTADGEGRLVRTLVLSEEYRTRT